MKGIFTAFALLSLVTGSGSSAARADEIDPASEKSHYHVFSGNTMYCEGMDPRVQHATDCRTLKDRDFAVTCNDPSYERSYQDDWSEWNSSHPDQKIPVYRIFTMSIPDRVVIVGGQKTMAKSFTESAFLVNVYQDPHTGRIARYTVERREPAQRPNPDGIKAYDDPRLPTPGADGTYAPRLSPNLKGKTTEEQAAEFERNLNGWIARARAGKCGFADEHAHALVYAVDPLQRNVDDFLGGCKGNPDFPCCSPEQKGSEACRINLALGQSTAATNLGDVDKAIGFTNAEFNLDMIQKMREGFLNTEAGILASTASGTSGIDGYKLGPSKAAGKCDSTATPGREQALSQAAAHYQSILADTRPSMIKARRFAEFQTNRQTVVDVLETAWAECLNRHYAIWGGDDEARAHYYGVVNRNRILGIIGKGGRADLYQSVKEGLRASGLAPKDFDFSVFEDRFKCASPGSLGSWKTLADNIMAIRPLEPAEYDAASATQEFKAIMSPTGIGGKIREAKRDALASLHKKLDKYGDKCGDADELYKPHFVMGDDGLDLWKDEGVVGAVVRDYTDAGRTAELKRLQYLYCRNVDVQANHDKWRNRIYIGVTAASMLLPIAPMALPAAAGTIGLLASGVATAATAVNTTFAVRDLLDKYGRQELAQETYQAELSGAQQMDETRKAFYEALIWDGTSIATSAFSVYRFASFAGQSWKAGKLLTSAEQSFYRYATEVIKKNELPPQTIRTLIRQCTDGDCTSAVRSLVRMSVLRPGGAKSALEAAAIAADEILERRAALFPKFAQEFGSAAGEALPTWTGAGALPHGKAYDRIFKLFQNPDAVYDGLQDLEAEVMTRSALSGKTRDQALLEVLGEWETKNGFKPSIALEKRIYSKEEWRQMLRDGALFRDEGLADVNRKSSFFAHGAETHRIQWNVVMRDMARNPQLYAEAGQSAPTAADLFKTLGSEELQANLDWSKANYSSFGGSEEYVSLWDELFDAPKTYRNFSSPEFVRPSHELWSAVGDWN